MKKIVLILMLSIMMLGCMTSGNVGKSLTLEKRVDSFNLKEYVIYYDQRGSNNALFGVCYIGNNIFLINNIELESGDEFTIKLELSIKKNTFEIKNSNIARVGKNMAKVGNIVGDFMNIISQYGEISIAENENTTIKPDEWPNYTLYHKYNKTIPLFSLYSTTYEKEEIPSFYLIKMGLFSDYAGAYSFSSLFPVDLASFDQLLLNE